MVTAWPKNLPDVSTAPVAMAKKIKQMNNDRLDITESMARGKLSPRLKSLMRCPKGTVQMSHGAPYYWKGKVPIAQLFASMPFGLTAQEMNAWLLHGGGLLIRRQCRMGCRQSHTRFALRLSRHRHARHLGNHHRVSEK